LKRKEQDARDARLTKERETIFSMVTEDTTWFKDSKTYFDAKVQTTAASLKSA